jgi:hypothetical protein
LATSIQSSRSTAPSARERLPIASDTRGVHRAARRQSRSTSSSATLHD